MVAVPPVVGGSFNSGGAVPTGVGTVPPVVGQFQQWWGQLHQWWGSSTSGGGSSTSGGGSSNRGGGSFNSGGAVSTVVGDGAVPPVAYLFIHFPNKMKFHKFNLGLHKGSIHGWSLKLSRRGSNHVFPFLYGHDWFCSGRIGWDLGRMPLP